MRRRTPDHGRARLDRVPERRPSPDDHGVYILRDVPAGKYTVFASAIGRAADSSSVTVNAGASATLDIALKEGSLLLSSVIVSRRARRKTRAKWHRPSMSSRRSMCSESGRESQDLLREIPAVELPRTSSLRGGTAQIVSIRGVDEGRPGVLFDGVPVNDAWANGSTGVACQRAMLDRVEVVRAHVEPYGNGRDGGMIQFFSRPYTGRDECFCRWRQPRCAVMAPSGAAGLCGSQTANIVGDYQERAVTIRSTVEARPVDVASQSSSGMRISPELRAVVHWSAYATGHPLW